MTWCDTCSEYRDLLNDNVNKQTCATCGEAFDDRSEPETLVGASAPWHFWVVVVALAGYLGWRVIEAILWVLG